MQPNVTMTSYIMFPVILFFNYSFLYEQSLNKKKQIIWIFRLILDEGIFARLDYQNQSLDIIYVNLGDQKSTINLLD